MTIGSKSPREDRDNNDLGRFGLGLKTASFSQCRKLTVISKLESKYATAQWDLDHVRESNKWEIKIPKLDVCDGLELFSAYESGTLIIWDNCDRIVDSINNDNNELLTILDLLEKHLKLIFHRYIAEGLIITVNGNSVEKYDPFFQNHVATQKLAKEIIGHGDEKISVEAFILPHHSKVSAREYELNAGDGGYIKNQGFYIYRNKRLLLHGSWLRLKPLSELTKLARVKIDLPNHLDDQWKIDIKKSRATPPKYIRDRLAEIIEVFSDKSVKVYTTRGKRKNKSIDSYWEKASYRGVKKYLINKKHPDITDFKDSLSEIQHSAFNELIDLISLHIPVDLIFSDYGQNPTSYTGNMLSANELEERAKNFIRRHKDDYCLDDFHRKFKQTEPYCQYSKNWEIFIKKVLNE